LNHEIGIRVCPVPRVLQQCFYLRILEFDDLLLSLVHHAAECSKQDVPSLEQERHVSRRKFGQFPVPRGEIKRRR
ncbi:MAG: hypothetical protein ABGZ35_14095, partial [Planctomycetaceae bacterium]